MELLLACRQCLINLHASTLHTHARDSSDSLLGTASSAPVCCMNRQIAAAGLGGGAFGGRIYIMTLLLVSLLKLESQHQLSICWVFGQVHQMIRHRVTLVAATQSLLGRS